MYAALGDELPSLLLRLIEALPIRGGELSPELQRALRIGIVAVAGLAVPVSLHALAAVV